MSEHNGTTTTEQTGPEPIPSVNGESLPPAAVDASAALVKVNAALTAFGKVCKAAADHNYAVGAAALTYSDLYLSTSSAAKFDGALDNLADEMARWSEDSLTTPLSRLRPRYRDRVGRLLRVSAVVRCLSGSTDAPKVKGRGVIPWGQCRELLPLLADGERGTFGIPEGVKVKADALWEEVKGGIMSREVIGAAATELIANYRAEEVKAAQVDRENKAAAQRVADKAAAEAKEKEDKAAAELAEKERAALAASGPEKVNLTAQTEAARADLADAQEAASAAVDDAAGKAAALALAEEEERNRVKAQVEADAKAKAKKDAADKASKGKAKDAPPATTPPAAPPAGGVTVKPGAPIPTDPRPPEPASGNVFANLAKLAKRSTPKDFAESLAGSIRAAGQDGKDGDGADTTVILAEMLSRLATDDATLVSILTALSDAANVSAKGKRAVQAALTLMTRKERGGVDPAVNGAPATAGAA